MLAKLKTHPLLCSGMFFILALPASGKSPEDNPQYCLQTTADLVALARNPEQGFLLVQKECLVGKVIEIPRSAVTDNEAKIMCDFRDQIVFTPSGWVICVLVDMDRHGPYVGNKP